MHPDRWLSFLQSVLGNPGGQAEKCWAQRPALSDAKTPYLYRPTPTRRPLSP